MRYLAVDYGTKRTGFAICDPTETIVSPLAVVQSNKRLVEKISELIGTENIGAIVLGLPLNMDDSEQEMTRAARRFANQLQGRYHLPVIDVDERLTSVEAAHIMRDKEQMARMGKQNNDATTDQIAAQLILTQYLNDRHRNQ